MMKALSATLLFLMVAFAGCVGSEGGDTATPNEVADDVPPASFDEGSGGVDGIVMDDELIPIAGAIVALQGDEENLASTAANGRFSLSNVAPGDHTLFVQALGYQSSASKIKVNVGLATFVEVRLEALPSEDPYISSENHQGQYGTGAALIRTTLCYGCNSNDFAWFGFNNGEGLPEDFEGLVVEAEWDTQDYLGFDFNQRTDPSAMWYRWRGQSPMHFFVERCGDYTGPPHFGRQVMPCTDEEIVDLAAGAHLETWYIGLLEETFTPLDPVCQTPVGSTLPGYEAGCYGVGTAPEMRWSTWVSFFHKELPANAAGYSVLGDR